METLVNQKKELQEIKDDVENLHELEYQAPWFFPAREAILRGAFEEAVNIFNDEADRYPIRVYPERVR